MKINALMILCMMLLRRKRCFGMVSCLPLPERFTRGTTKKLFYLNAYDDVCFSSFIFLKLLRALRLGTESEETSSVPNGMNANYRSFGAKSIRGLEEEVVVDLVKAAPLISTKLL